MRLQWLGLTWKCYIIWSTQLDDTQDGRWLYININTDKQKLYEQWSLNHYLITGSTNWLMFCSNTTRQQSTLNKNRKVKNIVFLCVDTYHPYAIHTYIIWHQTWSWLKVEVDMIIPCPNHIFFMSSLDYALFYHWHSYTLAFCICQGKVWGAAYVWHNCYLYVGCLVPIVAHQHE